MTKVFVVHRQLRKNRDTGELEDIYDVTPAQKYGTVEFLLDSDAVPFNADAVIKELHTKLRHMNPTDFLLLIGNPCLIAMAAAVASHHTGGKVQFLQWLGRRECYVPVAANVLDI